MSAYELTQVLGLIEEDDVDRRNSNRVSFDTTFGVAIFNGQSVPSQDQFTQVHGTDFSHTGISFTMPQWPASDQLVLMLGCRAKSVYAAARIVGCLCQRQSGDVSPHFEVRCEFERWL